MFGVGKLIDRVPAGASHHNKPSCVLANVASFSDPFDKLLQSLFLRQGIGGLTTGVQCPVVVHKHHWLCASPDSSSENPPPCIGIDPEARWSASGLRSAP